MLISFIQYGTEPKYTTKPSSHNTISRIINMRFRSRSRSKKADFQFDNKSSNDNLPGPVNDFLNKNGNRCGECGHTDPTWCSINLHTPLCSRCATVHNTILNKRSDVVHSELKSLIKDQWSRRDVDSLCNDHGRSNKQVWNPKHVDFPFDGDDDKSVVEQFIMDKYIRGRFRYDPIQPEDFGIEARNTNDRYEQSRSRGSGDYDGGRQGHRPRNFTPPPSSSSYTKSVTPPPPSLPSRPPKQSRKPKDAVFDGTGIVTPASASAATTAVTGQVQQYLDPATGVIYVDQGQYLAQQQAMQQQALQQQAIQQQVMQQQALQQQALQQQSLQQQALQQQALQQQALQQQANSKNSIMSLYQYPNAYTTQVSNQQQQQQQPR